MISFLLLSAWQELAAPAARPLPRLAAPFVAEAAGKAIEADTGHAAPFLIDFNRDGKQDLVVGEFGSAGGRARVYLNLGSNAEPRFGEFSYLQAGGADATVPSS